MFKAVNVKTILRFVISVLIPLSVGGLSALVTGQFSERYDLLVQPSYAPPAIVFPVVWTILYTLLGVALYLVIKDGFDKPGVREAVFYFAISLVLNFFWSPVFFRWGMILLALVWLLAMIVFAVVNVYQFYQINKAAGLIMVLYLIWLLFAFALNLGVYILNGPVI